MNNKQNQTKNTDHKKQEEFDEFVEFIGLPRALREEEFGYEDQRGFAMNYEVNEATLSEWKKEDQFWEKVTQKRNAWTKDRTPDVLLKLYETIQEEGRASEIRLWFEVVEDQEEEQQNVSGGFSLIEIAERTKEMEED